VELSFGETVALHAVSELSSHATNDVKHGSLRLRVSNHLPVRTRLTVEVRGARTRGNGRVRLQEWIGAGATELHTLPLDGVTAETAELGARFVFDLTGGGQMVTPSQAQQGVAIESELDVEPRALGTSGSGLELRGERSYTLSPLDLGLSGVESELRDITWDAVQLHLDLHNRSGVPLLVDTLLVAVADEAGRALAAAPVLLRGGEAPAGGRLALNASANALGNALIRRAVQGQTSQIRVTGALRAGRGTLSRNDGVTVSAALSAPLRFRLPASGFDLSHRYHLELDSTVARQLRSMDEAVLELAIVNRAPLDAAVQVALAATPADTTGFDPARAAERIELDPVRIRAADVDGTGAARSPVVTRVNLRVPGDKLGLLASGRFSAQVKVLLTSPAAGTWLQRQDALEIAPALRLVVRTGGER
jgi:hypothetical protein